MKRRYWIILAIVVAALAVGVWLYFGKKKESVLEWRTGKVERGDVRIVVTATGILSADTTVQVGTQVSGIISKIFVDFNSVVRKGQVVAMLDTTYLAASVEDAASSLYRAQVQVDLTKRTYDRTKQLFDEKVVAQADYDQAFSDYQIALGNLRSQKSSLERAKINLRYATIVAPVSGVVISRNVDRGQTVASSFNTPTLFTIANDLTKMQVQASIDEADIGKIKVGQEVTFTVDAYTDQQFEGTVRQIRLQPVTLQNVVNYTVIIDVPNPDMKLMPGMTANITVKIQEALNVIKVPASALRFTPPQDYIEKIMPELPDSVKKMLEKIKKFRERAIKKSSGSETTTLGGSSTGGQSSGGRSGGFSGNQASGGQGARENHGSTGTPGSWKGRSAMALVWVKEKDKLMPVRVKTGLSDGSYTEVEGNLKIDADVVTAIVTTSNTQASTTQQQQNPFAPQMPRPGGGRGGH
jgi:HlyD family secretion protein